MPRIGANIAYFRNLYLVGPFIVITLRRVPPVANRRPKILCGRVLGAITSSETNMKAGTEKHAPRLLYSIRAAIPGTSILNGRTIF